MSVTLQVDTRQAQALFSKTRSQVPFALAKTLTALAGDGKTALVGKLPSAFDRPTPFTLAGVFTRRADKATLTSEVYFPKSEQSSGKLLREYIRPGAQGASRRSQKRSEVLLGRKGYLPPGWITTPGYSMKGKLDQYGNLPGSYYKMIVQNLQIKPKGKPISVRSAKKATKMGVANELFAVAPGANTLGKNGGYLPSGVYQRTGPGGRTLVQLLKFVARAGYKQRLDVRAVALVAVQQNAQKRWNEAVQSIGEGGAFAAR